MYAVYDTYVLRNDHEHISFAGCPRATSVSALKLATNAENHEYAANHEAEGAHEQNIPEVSAAQEHTSDMYTRLFSPEMMTATTST
jgi:hypothetical protein